MLQKLHILGMNDDLWDELNGLGRILSKLTKPQLHDICYL